MYLSLGYTVLPCVTFDLFNALVYASSDVHIVRPSRIQPDSARFGLFPQGSVLAGFFFRSSPDRSIFTNSCKTYIFLIPGRNGKN